MDRSVLPIPLAAAKWCPGYADLDCEVWLRGKVAQPLWLQGFLQALFLLHAPCSQEIARVCDCEMEPILDHLSEYTGELGEIINE